MKKNLFLLTAVLLCSCGSALGWGRDGHTAIAYIAECNLTPTAKKNVEKILGNRSIVYYSSWLDHVRETPEYKFTTKWHGNAVDSLCRYVPAPKGDAVTCIESSIAQLKNYKSLDDSTVVVAVRYLIHLVGDMHCPSHIKYPWYKSFPFELNGTKVAFHAYWDTHVLAMNFPWSYTEYAHQLDRCTQSEKRAIGDGTPREWLEQSAQDCCIAFELCIADKSYTKAETSALMLATRPLAELQILRGGYRLARILNELFG